MNDVRYLIVPCDPNLNAFGAGDGAEIATLGIARALAASGRSVIVGARLTHEECVDQGVEFWDTGAGFDVEGLVARVAARGDYHLVAIGRAQALCAARHDPRCRSRCFIAAPSGNEEIGVSLEALSPLCDGIICSTETQAAVLRAEGVDAGKILFEARPGAAGMPPTADLSNRIVALCERSGVPGTHRRGPVGWLTTWNQQCGLATHAEYVLAGFEPHTFTVYAEDSAELTRSDESFVRRCWSREAADYDALYRAVRADGIALLHLNCHYGFFHYPAFGEFLRRVRADGVTVIANLHTTFTADPRLRALVTSVDAVVVHSPESRLEAIANGAEPAVVFIESAGVRIRPQVSDAERRALRARLGMPADEAVITCFGFIQPHKGMEGAIESLVHLKERGIAAHGFIIGRPNPDDQGSLDYLAYLKQIARDSGVSDQLTIIEEYKDDEEVSDWLVASDVVLMNYRSRYFEASGACSFALGAGAVVAASIAPPFMAFGDAVWHITSGYPPGLSVEVLLREPELRAEIRRRAERYAQINSWAAVGRRLRKLYERLGVLSAPLRKENAVEQTRRGTIDGQALRVLMQNRPNALTQRGGDTVLMERLAEGLRARGVQVTVDLEGREDLRRFDLVHLFNFALPDMVRGLAERASRAGVPYVVTTLYEDIPAFHNQSVTMAQTLVGYVQRGQDRSWYQAHRPDLRMVPACARFENSWAAEHAAALLSNGAAESAALRRDYPAAAGRIREIRLGHEVGAAGSREAFLRAYGVENFILCVGRLESRKNQLMLLKALEDSEIPVVLATGGFSYQPEYAEAVRRFRRRGKTIVLDRITPEMLASAYAAAKVHALPSWYELPGLVSLEAASHDCNLVMTENGTSFDYFGNLGFYCDPGSEHSVRNAVLAAWHAPVAAGLGEIAAQCRWDAMAAETVAVYREVTGRSEVVTTQSVQVGAQWAPAGQVPGNQSADSARFQEILEQGEAAARSRDFGRAHELLSEAQRMNPASVRAWRAEGAVFLAEERVRESRGCFEQALTLDPGDPRSLSGLGMCAVKENAHDRAYGYLLRALRGAPDQLVAILQLIECAYVLGRFDDLERVLREYTRTHPADLEMQFCLAGCLYKLGRFGEARSGAEQVLAGNPAHVGARELLERLTREAPQQASAAPLRARVETQIVTVPEPRSESPRNQLIDVKLGELQELKQQKDYAGMKRVSTELLTQPGLSTEQIEQARVFKAEAEALDGDLEAARAIYGQVLKERPTSARALCGLGALAAHRGEWSGARGFFEQALRHTPDLDMALAGLGLCCSRTGELDEAWHHYRRAVQRNPENMRALLGMIELGYPRRAYGEVEEAIRNYLDMHPADVEFLYALAGCCFAQERLEEAQQEIRRIQLFDPLNARAAELQQMIDQRRSAQGAARPV